MRLNALILTLIALFHSGNVLALKVAVISDLNPSYGKTQYSPSVDAAIARIIALKPDLVISTGDMVAGQRPRRHLKRKQLEAMWKSFHQHVSDPLAVAGIPLAVTPGNHDASVYPNFALERKIYTEQWSKRRPAVSMIDGKGYPLRYAFAFDDTLFVSLDVTRSGALSDEQMAWLDTLLQQQGGNYRYRVLFSHLPMWAFAVKRENDIIADPALEALLNKHDVDLYLSGHHHAYFPGYKDGIVYVGQSCLGGGARRLLGSKHRSARSFTWIDLGPEQASVNAYMAPEFDTAVHLHKLPGHLSYRGATLQRLDLAPPGHSRVVPAAESTAHGS